MVHALEKSRSLLSSQGIVLNVHDLPRPERIMIHAPDGETFAGFLLNHTDFENQRLADEALAQVVKNGLFQSEEHLFNYLIHIDSYLALKDHLTESWKNSYLPGDTLERIRHLLNSAGKDAEILVRMMARLSILIPTAAMG